MWTVVERAEAIKFSDFFLARDLRVGRPSRESERALQKQAPLHGDGSIGDDNFGPSLFILFSVTILILAGSGLRLRR
jgi:hypothetical protein